jgi:predicted DsbA family dithiol-disulfide isomerase
LRERYRDQIHVRFVMGGLIKDFSEFYDALNDIRTPAETLPHWRMVSERSGQPIDERFWADVTDPHFSTWPANIAVKAAAFQGEEIGDRYLRRLRIAVETARVQISQRDEQLRLAREVPGLDVDLFAQELDSERARAAFAEDRAICATFGVSGFPTMLFVPPSGEQNDAEPKSLLVGGHRSLATYERVLAMVAPSLQQYAPRGVEALLAEYGPLTTRELSEITGLEKAAVEEVLRAAVAAGRLTGESLRGGDMWALPQQERVAVAAPQ